MQKFTRKAQIKPKAWSVFAPPLHGVHHDQHVGVRHPCPFLPDKDVVHINQDIPRQTRRLLFIQQKSHGVKEEQLVQPEL